MYGGLFGDLPAAKKKESSSSSNNQSVGGGLFGDLPATKKGSKDPANIDDTYQDKDNTGESSSATSIPKVEVPPSNTQTPALPTKNETTTATQQQPSSFLKTVGTAGTSMAFVPAAARRKKRPRPISNADPGTTRANPASALPAEKASTAISKQVETVSESSASHFQASMYTTTTTTQNQHHESSQNPAVVDIHESTNNKTQESLPLDQGTDPFTQSDAYTQDEEILDIYDPYVPNDLLQYLARQKLLQERKAMEEEQRQALEDQLLLEKQLEEERRTMEQTGDYGGLIQQRGRGRGRGVSNLPAWLVEKQRKEREEGLGQSKD